MSKRVCYDVTPYLDHWLITVEGVPGSDKYASMYAAMVVAHEAARVRWAEFGQPSCVRVKVDLAADWMVPEDYG